MEIHKFDNLFPN